MSRIFGSFMLLCLVVFVALNQAQIPLDSGNVGNFPNQTALAMASNKPDGVLLTPSLDRTGQLELYARFNETDDIKFIHFKFWCPGITDTLYVPSDIIFYEDLKSTNLDCPNSGPIPLLKCEQEVCIIWKGAQAFFDSTNKAENLGPLEWSFLAYTQDINGNLEPAENIVSLTP